jgi:threonine dehydrogenase-like Zn-dependent dehydrogenase
MRDGIEGGERMMRAASIAGPRHVEITMAPLPTPPAGHVRIRLRGTGVCGSNLPVFEGRPWFHYPLAPGAPGHEGWGVVDALGDGVEHLAPGHEVTFLSERAFAEFDIAPAEAVVRLPSSLAATPVPGEAIACAVNVVRRSAVGPGETVAVVGVGFLGALAVQLATRAGARVVAISRRRTALDVAMACGAAEVVPLTDPQATVADALAAHGGQPFDCVIEAVGSQRALDVAGALPGERRRLVIAGYHQDGRREVDLQSWNWRGLDVINAHEREPAVYVRGLHAAVDLVALGGIDLGPLLTHVFPLERAHEAFEAAVARPDGFMKALVTCEAA